MGDMLGGILGGSGGESSGGVGGILSILGDSSGKAASDKAQSNFSALLSKLGGGTPVAGDKSAFNPAAASKTQGSLIGKLRGIVNDGLDAQQDSEDRLRNRLNLSNLVTGMTGTEAE